METQGCKFIITNEILNLTSQIDEFKGSWWAFNTILPKRLEILKESTIVESVASNARIDRVESSDEEIKFFLENFNKNIPKAKGGQEVAGYADAMKFVFDNFQTIDLCEHQIKQIHAILFRYNPDSLRHRGEYKKLDNNIIAFNAQGKEMGIIFKTVAPFETKAAMTNLIEWANNNLSSKKIHPLLVIAIFVMEFLEIYPFQSGNSRLSRILTNLLLLKSGYHHCLYSSLEKIIEETKSLYYQSLFGWQKIPDNQNIKFDGWILFFLECLKQQKENLENKFQNEKILQNKLDNLHLQVMDILKCNNLLSISQIQALSGANRNTLKVKLRDLVKLQKISSLGKGKGMVYNINAVS